MHLRITQGCTAYHNYYYIVWILLAHFHNVNNSPRNMSQGQSSNSTHKDWLVKSIQEGFIKHYSEDDILDRTLLGHGGYGVVYKARIKHSGKLVAMKTLFINRYGCEDELYKQFVKEVGTTYLSS